ncbi:MULTISPECIES: glutamate racemase [unclassified Fusibacter]|uniref:glutamate racemase n=1 Tax=unclassified Fusibacter TaxID=2624464 RepID=UPI00101312A4|nr:glutamate racemase [Fusibacter sp. A1]MCK8059211.1 glutamate racemase [Fusibacter sp. A2]NPE21326.1 glutamate racemase [Fusibacter sp. A1]RXV62589.1 glutamate racemase [Fusibacter sp. A1]
MKSNKCAPIGVFDSGLGGVSVVNTIRKILPNENIIYYGDSKHAPYGPQTVEQVIGHSQRIVEYFITLGVKAVVIACNTATSAAASHLRNQYELPIIGMEPALKPAALAHPGGHIAVLATEMTLRESKFEKLMDQYLDEVTIIKCPTPEFVELVESQKVTYQEVYRILDQVISKEERNQISGVVLGCTHFIFLKQTISAYFNHTVNIYDGNLGTSFHLKRTLQDLDLLCDDAGKGSVTIENSAGEQMVELATELLEKDI